MRRVFLFCLFGLGCAIAGLAQPANNTAIFVTVAPSGSCTNGVAAQLVVSTGFIYTCQSSTWAQAGGASGTYLPLTGGTPQYLGATYFASYFSGADCGAKINAALTALGGAGVVEVNAACGSTISTAVTVGANQHLFVRPGTYTVSGIITLSGQSASAECDPASDIPGTTYGSCYFIQANTTNLAELFLLSGTNTSLVNVVVDGNGSNNTSSGPNILVTGLRARLQYVSSINSHSHGATIGNGTTNAAAATKLDHVMMISNTGDGLHCTVTGDIFVGDQSEFENNGANGISLTNCGAARVVASNDISGNTLDGIQISGSSTAAVSAYNNLIDANIFSQNGKNDVEIDGWDGPNSTYASLYNTVSNNIFQGSQNHGNGAYSAIYSNSGGYNSIIGNVVQDLYGSSLKFLAGVNLVTGSGTEVADTVSGNTIVTAGTPIVAVTSTVQGDNTLNGAGGPVTGTGVCPSSTVNSNTCLGLQTSPSSGSDTNETVIGAYTTGAGPNTTIIGSTLVTDTYIRGTLHPAGLIANSSLTGGTIDNAVIGGTTPAAGSFTTLAASGGITATSDGVHAGYDALIGNMTNQAVVANTWGIMGPAEATYTGWTEQPANSTSGGPSGISFKEYPAVASSVSAWTLVGSTGTGNVVLATQPTIAGVINGTTPIRDQTRSVLVANMTAVSTAGVNIGSTGASNVTFSWPVTAANWYDLECKLPVTFAITATIKFQLVSISGSSTISNVNSETMGDTGASGVFQDLATIAGTSLATSTTPVTGAPGASEQITYSAQFLSSHAGNIGLEFIANGTNNVTMLLGGECGITQIN